MAYQIEHDIQPADTVLSDRRRPGRADFENPHLLRLLRGASNTDEALPELDASCFVEPPESERDALSGARGILIGCAISACLWVAAGLAIRLL
jgi:hypothetical protein